MNCQVRNRSRRTPDPIRRTAGVLSFIFHGRGPDGEASQGEVSVAVDELLDVLDDGALIVPPLGDVGGGGSELTFETGILASKHRDILWRHKDERRP